jgi:hypothetical protein
MNKKLKLTLSAIVILAGVVFMAYRGYQLGQWLKTHDLF